MDNNRLVETWKKILTLMRFCFTSGLVRIHISECFPLLLTIQESVSATNYSESFLTCRSFFRSLEMKKRRRKHFIIVNSNLNKTYTKCDVIHGITEFL